MMDWMPGTENVTTSLVFVTVFLVVLSFIKREKTNIPGPFALPIIGNSIQVVMTPLENMNQMLEQQSKKYGDIFRLRIGENLFVFIGGYDNIHNTFVKKAQVASDRPVLPIFRNTDATRGILWSSGEYWKKVRRLTIHTMRDFGMGKRSLEGIVLEEAKNIDSYFEKHKGVPIHDIKRTMTLAVGNTIHSIIFGFRCSHDDEQFQCLIDSLDGLLKLFNFLSVNVAMPLWLRLFLSPRTLWTIRRYRNVIRSYIKRQKEEHMASFDENNIRNFIDLHIKNENSKLDDSYDDQTIFVLIINLFAAGTETTATTLDWSLLYMIAYPDIQRKCYEEIHSVVGDGRMVKLNDRGKLVYTEATIMEIQRVANTLSTTLPHMTSEDTTVNGYHIPKGAVLLGLLSSAHSDPKYWKDPHKFNPERFIDENGKLIKNDAFIPFSLGPRVCAGESLAKMELFLIFSNLIQRYKFEKVDERDELCFAGVSGGTLSAKPYRLIANLR